MEWSSPELCDVCGQINSIRQQIFSELVSLVLQDLSQVVGNLPGDLLHEHVQLSEVIGQTNQLVEGAYLQIRDMKLPVCRELLL